MTAAAFDDPWVVGVTGASGTPYAAAIVRGLLAAGAEVDLIVTEAARLTMPGAQSPDLDAWLRRDAAAVRCWEAADLSAEPAGDDYRTAGMIIAPATAATVAGIAAGATRDLVQLAADVTLEERRPLVVLLRETTLRLSTLDSLRVLAAAGATIMPASPAFYGARDVDRLVEFVAGRVLDQCDVDHDFHLRSAGTLSSTQPDVEWGERVERG